MYLIVALVTVCVLGGARAQVVFSGQCPSVTVQSDFDVNRYMGRWYEMERFFAVFEVGSKCVRANYKLESDGSVTVNNTGYYSLLNRYVSALGDAVVTDPKNPAKLGVRFSRFQPRGPYWVLSTDYGSYTVVWSCSQHRVPIIGVNWNTQFLWILTREQQGVPEDEKRNIYSLIQGFGIDTGSLSPTDQTGCP